MWKGKGALLLFALFSLLCLSVLLLYAVPWGARGADWSISVEDAQEWRGDRGWSVYAMRGGRRVPLTPDGTGGYLGCAPGETFYFSRLWDADIDRPVLRLDAATASVAVWLDGALQYADAPLADASIGAETLPMLEGERLRAVEISLGGELAGRELTIAQASPLVGEKQGSETVYPCAVEVTRAYDYERGLIAQSYRLGLFSAFLALAALLLCGVALWRRDGKPMLLALLAFVRLCAVILCAPFFSSYTQSWETDFGSLANQLSFTFLLGFLAAECGKRHGLMASMSALHGLSVLAALLTQALRWQSDLFTTIVYLPDRLAVVFLAAALAVSAWQAKNRNAFFRLFLKLFCIGLAAGLCCAAICLPLHPSTLAHLLSRRMVYARFLREPILWLMQGALLVAVLLEVYRQATAARERRVFESVFAQAARQSYESLKRHQDEVMLLRHETTRHYAALKGLVEAGQNERADAYLEELLARQRSVSQVVNSANELVNIILNSRVAWAESAGICVEIRHMSVPPTLPLPDADVVSLLLNVVDNAIEAARRVEGKSRLLLLDMHCKNDYFIFYCENTWTEAPESGATDDAPYHGYGRQIIEKIMAPYGNLVVVRKDAERYSVSVALPLRRAAGNADALSEAPLGG